LRHFWRHKSGIFEIFREICPCERPFQLDLPRISPWAVLGIDAEPAAFAVIRNLERSSAQPSLRAARRTRSAPFGRWSAERSEQCGFGFRGGKMPRSFSGQGQLYTLAGCGATCFSLYSAPIEEKLDRVLQGWQIAQPRASLFGN